MSTSVSSWRRLSDQSYERPLGRVEAGFYWAAISWRATDMVRCSQITVDAGELEKITRLPNVVRAWTNVKKRYPLLGARVYERDNDVFLNVSEDRLLRCQSNEISLQEIPSPLEAVQLADNVLKKEEQLSNDLLARIVVAKDGSRTDSFYFLFVNAHVIADGLSTMSVIKTFMNELCGVSPDQPAWEECLALSVASDDLNPAAKSSTARRRWRHAIAAVIAGRRLARLKGGHGLPQKKTQFTPARSAHRIRTLAPEVSMRIIQNCRRMGVTFGTAYPIIAQVAAARLLLRHYLAGKIDEEEWDFRKKEPMYSVGPFNLRPLLEPKWLAAGGMDHVCVAIDFYFYSISFLPLGSNANLKPGMALPEVGDLLTRDRFRYRAKVVQKQAKAILKNPLCLEIGDSMMRQRRRVERAREEALAWKESDQTMRPLERVGSPMEQAAGFVVCNGGSSLGNMDKLLPSVYPMGSYKSFDPEVRLRLGQVMFRLRCRPCELYLGAATMQNQLMSFVHFDANVFDEGVVDEWLDEMKLALEFYLGEENNI